MSIGKRFSKDPITRYNLVEAFEEAHEVFHRRIEDLSKDELLAEAEEAYLINQALEGSIETARRKWKGYLDDPFAELKKEIEDLEKEIADLK